MKRFLISLLAAASLIPTAVSANEFKFLDQSHQQLSNTLEQVGVKVLVNDPNICTGWNDGMFFPEDKILFVCQGNAITTRETKWTPNDLDTLRHESIHVAQTCEANGTFGGHPRPIRKTKEEIVKFASSSLSDETVEWIFSTYKDRGASLLMIGLEIEAFSSAASQSPEEIANQVKESCGVQ